MDHSTTARGNAFRDQVAHILALKYPDVSTEVNVGGKNADVVFSEQTIAGLRRYAVECKHTASTLSYEDLARIQVSYGPAQMRGDVSGLIIVGNGEITPHARLSLQPWATYLRFSRLMEDVLGLQEYSEFLAKIDQVGDLASFYVDPEFVDGTDALGRLDAWIEAPSQPALAILGGYGSGKTSLSRRLAARLAAKYRQSGTTRIPILVELGLIASEQDLEGLLGKLFTSIHRGRDFNFQRLISFSEAGRLVFIFDGFDEMKHAITWDEFVYNFRQINRLVTDQSKVLILGRPSALTSEDEYNYVLKGERRLGDKVQRMADWPAYEEHRLALFDDLRLQQFIERYMRSALKEEIEAEEIEILIEEKREALKSLPDPELILRPVQAKMVLDLILKSDVQLADLNRHSLYKQFIDFIIERDTTSKLSRVSISAFDRRRIARYVAWWLWTDRRTTSFTYFALEEHIKNLRGDHFMKVFISGPGSLREVLVGSCFEVKEKHSYYFPHRSFQEFLTAEYLESLAADDVDVRAVNGAFTAEIRDFVGFNAPNDLRAVLHSAVARERRPIGIELLRFLAERYAGRAQRMAEDFREDDPFLRLLVFVAYYEQARTPQQIIPAIEPANLARLSDQDIASAFCAWLVSEGSDVASAASARLSEMLVILFQKIGAERLAEWTPRAKEFLVPADCVLARDVLSAACRVTADRTKIVVNLQRLAEIVARHVWSDTSGTLLPFEPAWVQGEVEIPIASLYAHAIKDNGRLRDAIRILTKAEFSFSRLRCEKVKAAKSKHVNRAEAKPNRVHHRRR